MKKISKRDREQAWAKFEKAGLTDRQKQIIQDDILWLAVDNAEERIERQGEVTIMPQWRARCLFKAPQNAINSLVWQWHDRNGHFWTVNADGTRGFYTPTHRR